jgi:2-polyprenyl-3-methyl-5-hydroxy-6-metoxy-1,4-benzoquinol methylase
MDYRQQQAYLRNSRIRGLIAVMIFLVASASCAWLSGVSDARILIVYVLVSVALAGSIYYAPDYLHLTVVPDKAARWQVKIRWRIIAALLVLGLVVAETPAARILVLIAAAWLAGCTLAITKLARVSHYSLLFLLTDLMLGLVYLPASTGLLLASLLFTFIAHFAVVTARRIQAFTIALFGIVAFGLGFLAAFMLRNEWYGFWCASLVALTPLLTGWLVVQARKHNQQNIAAAMKELVAFTGYTLERIRELWETSNQQLAKNWEQAAIPHDDRERMAEWYRQNSELYLFAISAYNLEYKRIKSNLKVIRFARGSTLDYGAGNGEILLELARRGHPATYFDVEGVTMRFARSRAEQQKLAINFARTKDELRSAAQLRGFDTIFSFDVLEHLPDLPGELTFLSSLLAPGGVFVFDVPAGSTKAHPMHLNHNLNVLEYLKAKGLKDRRGLYLRMPFRKEEKWVFEA